MLVYDSLVFENLSESNFVSTKRAASFLDKSENAIRIMVLRGKLSAYKDGTRLKFRLADLRRALQKKEA